MGDLVAINTPAVIVLGERKGTQPDLARAAKIVAKLQKLGSVTVALQAVPTEHQAVLDQYSRGTLTVDALEAALHIQDTWGFPFAPYLPLVTAADDGVRVLGIGGAIPARTPDDVLPVPPSYIHVLGDAMGDALMPVELERRFVERVAWTDHVLAARAFKAWDAQGSLVIIADRLHVEGGKGVSWQAQRLTSVRVHTAILSASNTPCYSGDRLLR